MKKIVSLLTVATALGSVPAMAYQAGDIVVRGGIAQVSPDSKTGDVASPLAPLNTLSGAASVDAATGVTVTGTYLFHKNFGVEVVGALPFSHSIQGDGALDGVGKIGDTQHLPPTVFLQFYPVEKNTVVMPYVGIGYNYTIFFKNDTNETFADTVDAVLHGSGAALDGSAAHVTNTSLALTDSHGVAAEIGADWPVTKNLSINTSVMYVNIKSRATIDADLNTGARIDAAAKFDVTIDPYVYNIGAAYTF